MIIIKNAVQQSMYAETCRAKGKTIGFVPTMGALHPGHIALVKAALLAYDVCIVSIFVNPTQFNNPDDLLKYPRTIETDIDLLEKSGCHCLYLPPVEEIYPDGRNVFPKYTIGKPETIFEGEHRPGHFKGVVQVVDVLLKTVQPDALYLGSKDFQQCIVLQDFVDAKYPGITVNKMETVRESSGLAMSSRNKRLSEAGKMLAANIYRALLEIKKEINLHNYTDLFYNKKEQLTALGIHTEYLQFARLSDLEPLPAWDGKQPGVILIAAQVEAVRLIDNIVI